MQVGWVRCTQPSSKRRVALKVIRAEHATEDNIRRFARESEVLGRLQHSGIAQIYAAGAADAKAFFAMELVQGRPLDEYLHGEEHDTMTTTVYGRPNYETQRWGASSPRI